MIIFFKRLKNLFLRNETNFIKRCSLLFLFLSLFSQNIGAQDTISVDTLNRVLQPLTISQLPDFGKASRRLIREVNEMTEQQASLDQIMAELPGASSDIYTKLNKLKDSTVVYRLDILDKEKRELDLIQERLDKWEASEVQWLEDALVKKSKIDSLLKIGRLTRDSLHAKELDTIDSDSKSIERDTARINMITKLKSDLDSHIFGLMAAQSNLADWTDQIQQLDNSLTVTYSDFNEATTLLGDKNQQIMQQIWIPEYPPIWEMSLNDYYIGDQPKLRTIIQNSLHIVQSFIRNNPHLAYYAGFTFLLFLSLILYLRFNSAEFFAMFPEKLKESKVILQQPVFSSLILTWFVVRLFIDLPIELTRLIALFMLIPVSVMFWLMDKQHNKKRIIIFIVLFLLFLIIPQLHYFPNLQRFSLLGIDVGACLILLWARNQKEELDELKDLWFGFLPLTIRIFILISVVGVIANIIGALQLTQLLTVSILGTFILFILLSEVILLAKSFLFLILLGPLFKKSFILQEDSEKVLKKVDFMLRILGFGFWIYVTLGLLTIRDVVWNAFNAFIHAPFTIGAVSISLGNLFAFFIIIQFSVWLSNFIRYFLDKEVFPRVHLHRGIPNTISLMIRFTLIILGFVMALAGAGIPFDKLAIAMGALGVGIGFGLQNIVNNFISGIILAIERPIQIGDTVDIGSVSGVVKDIGFRASQVRSWDGADVIIPNGELLSGSLINWTMTNKQRRVIVEVRVPFDSNPQAVKDLLLKTAAGLPEVMKNPGPYLNFKGIGESAMEINLYCWISNVDNVFSYGTAIRTAIYDALQKAGYEIPIPKSDIQLKTTKDIKETNKDRIDDKNEVDK